MMSLMLFAYIDETGDTGPLSKKGASACFALGCIIIDAEDWSMAFDELLTLRRNLRARYGVLVRPEIKSTHLVSGSGALRGLGLSPNDRKTIYRAHLKTIEKFNGRAFSVIVDKAKSGKSGQDLFRLTWTMMLQRLERTCTHDEQSMMIFHDNGENLAVRREVRKARQFLTAGGNGTSFRFKMPVVEDAISRDSSSSYLIQIADMVAYAGWRSYMHPSAFVKQVVPKTTWSQLGASIHTPVNSRKLNGSVPGVVLFP